MARAARLVASATVGSLIAFGAPLLASAQTEPASVPVVRTSQTAGAIIGSVKDDHGQAIANAVVSAVGATTAIAVTDKSGRFEFGPLAPGEYLLRAHLAGYVAPRGLSVHVNASSQATSAITLSRLTSSAPILAAGLVGALPSTGTDASGAAVAGSDDADTSTSPADNHGETAWRIRHARRSVLKDVMIPVELLTDDDDHGSGSGFVPVQVLGKAVGSSAHVATSLFSDSSLSGQVNLLTTGSFDSPQELFSTDMLSRNIAYVRVGAPVGTDGNWTARGAVNQADISSWIVAGSYTTRSQAARHQYDVGLSYSTQRYDGGNLLALRDVSENTRNVGRVYAYDTLKFSPMLAVTYGAAYGRYDYLKDRSLVSPRVEVTLTPVDQWRITSSVSRRALAPGAEEFLPPGDTGIWLPPQRTFSSLNPRGGFYAEETAEAEVGVEHDFGASTVSARAFKQHVDNQLVTVFGAEIPGQPGAKVGHYEVGNLGNADATGCAFAFRTVIANRLRGSVEYTTSSAGIMPSRHLGYLLLVAPSMVGPIQERLHDVATSLETEVPETATRVLVLYRVGNGFARPAGTPEAAFPGIDSRFDVQVRQSLPFMNFSNAKWEMLLAVRNFFRESGSEQSVLDERVSVRPPKRVVGGVTLRF
jgi:Carboxypeptidase regulatory-like domain/TonB dependent receptor-like, beta-barrel